MVSYTYMKDQGEGRERKGKVPFQLLMLRSMQLQGYMLFCSMISLIYILENGECEENGVKNIG